MWTAVGAREKGNACKMERDFCAKKFSLTTRTAERSVTLLLFALEFFLSQEKAFVSPLNSHELITYYRYLPRTKTGERIFHSSTTIINLASCY